MTDYISYLPAVTLILFSTVSEIPGVIQQSIAITVLLIIIGYQMTRQEKVNRNIAQSIDKNSESIDKNSSAIQDLINNIGILIRQSETTRQENRDTITLLIEHIEKEKK